MFILWLLCYLFYLPSAHTKIYIFSTFFFFSSVFYNIFEFTISTRVWWNVPDVTRIFLFFLQHFCLPSHLLYKKCQEWRGKVLSEENFLPRENWMKISAVIIGSLALSMIYIVTMKGISKLLRDINDCWIEEEIWENIF